MLSEEGLEKFHTWWHITTQILVVLLIVWNKFPSRHDQSEALPTTWHLLSDASSVWNFCGHFSDVISQGNRWWRQEMLTIFSGYYPAGRWCSFICASPSSQWRFLLLLAYFACIFPVMVCCLNLTGGKASQPDIWSSSRKIVSQLETIINLILCLIWLRYGMTEK